MNKKIIPAEASFFVPVEKVLFDHSRMRRSLETAAAGFICMTACRYVIKRNATCPNVALQE